MFVLVVVLLLLLLCALVDIFFCFAIDSSTQKTFSGVRKMLLCVSQSAQRHISHVASRSTNDEDNANHGIFVALGERPRARVGVCV